MSSAVPIVSFFHVGLFPKKKFGISEVSFQLRNRGKYRIVTDSDDQTDCLLRLLEGRHQPCSGLIRKQKGLFVQSDRLLMGDRVIGKKAEEYLNLRSSQFRFDGRRRSKMYFIDLLAAKHILFFPVYKLQGEDRIKFALLSLLFQGSGLTLISEVVYRELNAVQAGLLAELLQKGHCTICVFPNGRDGLSNANLESVLDSLDTLEIK